MQKVHSLIRQWNKKRGEIWSELSVSLTVYEKPLSGHPCVTVSTLWNGCFEFDYRWKLFKVVFWSYKSVESIFQKFWSGFKTFADFKLFRDRLWPRIYVLVPDFNDIVPNVQIMPGNWWLIFYQFPGSSARRIQHELLYLGRIQN